MEDEEAQKENKKVILTDSAFRDLNDIHDYYYEDVSEKVADQITDEIWKSLDLLLQGKLIYSQREPYLDHLKREYRRLVVSNYKIIYFIGKTGICINRVFDARQNPKKMKVR